MAEDPQPMTLQQRIAALNVAQVGRLPVEPPRPTARPSPQVPARRPNLPKQKTVNNPPEQLNGSVTDTIIGNRPAPPPLPARKAPPPLPARKGSDESERRPSIDSTSSAVTTASSTSRTTASRSRSSDRIKAPAWGECDLPALPPRGQASKPRTYSTERPKYVNRAPSSSTCITPASSTDGRRLSQPALPPRLPARKAEVSQEPAPDIPPVPSLELRTIPPMPSAEALERVKRSALSYGLNKPKPQPQPQSEVGQAVAPESSLEPRRTPSVPSMQTLERVKRSALSFGLNRPQSQPEIVSDPVATLPPSSASPPPVPLSSRPDVSAIQSTKPKFSSNTSHVNGSVRASGSECLVCRDFSGPDSCAARFPRQQVSSLPNLAHDLTSPFPSATDKARAICTWLHLNISYDVENFFRGTVKGSTPQSTLQTGLAVCEGYAALFTNLATHAGLQSVVIGGHGKGFGYSPLAPGSPLPPYEAGHAWNACRIDDGEWKLIDPCWYSGHVQGAGMPYVAKLNASMFTMSNEEFGIKHFPGNKEHFFLPGGRCMSWEEYIQINPDQWPHVGIDPPTIYTASEEEYFIGKRTVVPQGRKISVRQGGTQRFQFGLRCAHWTLERHTSKGPPPVFLMSVEGVDGRNKDLIPFEHRRGNGGGGDVWFVDIPAKELGAPGQTISCFAITSFGDSKECRGLTVAQFREKKGRIGMGFTGVAAWELVA